MNNMAWAAYERVSTEEQAEEGHSIQVQMEAIERYIKTIARLSRRLARNCIIRLFG